MSLTVTHWKMVDGKKVITKTVSSIKNHTLRHTTPAPAPPSPPTDIKTACAPTPFIDKISVVLEPANEEDALYIHGGLWNLFNEPGIFLDMKGGKWGVFKVAKKIALDSVLDVKKYPLFQYAFEPKTPDKPGKALKMRIEFVPVDLGWQGLLELHATLSTAIPNGWHYFIANGHITRLDIAVDFPDVLIDDFHFLALQGATTKQWRVNGKLQGYTHGKPKGNHTAIYDRGAKRIALGQSAKGKEGMRVERRIKSLSIAKLADLIHLPNPFGDMKLVSMPEAPPSESKKFLFIWDLFRRAADAEGLMGALALLPKDRRTLYRKHLAANTHPWWNPDAIWANWPAMLKELEIGTAKTWY